jgi:hypothetical protein
MKKARNGRWCPRTAPHDARARPIVGFGAWVLAWCAMASACVAADTVPTQVLPVGASTLRIFVPDTPFTAGRDELLRWVARDAAMVRGYYGFFPVRQVDIELRAVAGDAVHGGRASWRHGGGLLIRVGVGREVTSGALLHDWVLVHEMIHLALPDVSPSHSWLSEGLATYVEGIARTQAGNMTAEELWAEYRHDMPKGLPESEDEGLDRTHTWARTYWGGALFCLNADIAIHERTANRRGLQDALRAIARESGGMSADWPIARVLATGDAATGTHVLEELYAAWKDLPQAPDMADLWRRLERAPAPADGGLGALSIAAAITRPTAGSDTLSRGDAR